MIRPSPNELERLKRDEFRNRRIQRLKEVRQISKDQAIKLRVTYKNQKKRIIEKFAETIQEQLCNKDKEELEKLRLKLEYQETHIGEAHEDAGKRPDIANEKHVKKVQDDENAIFRHKKALQDMWILKEQNKLEKLQKLEAKKFAMDVEKDRAAAVASLPPPVPFSYQAIMNDDSVPRVKVCDQTKYSLIESMKPGDYRVERMEYDTENGTIHNGKEAGQIRQDELDKARQNQHIESEEQILKAYLRGNQALKKQLVKKDYDELVENLEQISKSEMVKRQKEYYKNEILSSAAGGNATMIHNIAMQQFKERCRERAVENVVLNSLKDITNKQHESKQQNVITFDQNQDQVYEEDDEDDEIEVGKSDKEELSDMAKLYSLIHKQKQMKDKEESSHNLEDPTQFHLESDEENQLKLPQNNRQLFDQVVHSVNRTNTILTQTELAKERAKLEEDVEKIDAKIQQILAAKKSKSQDENKSKTDETSSFVFNDTITRSADPVEYLERIKNFQKDALEKMEGNFNISDIMTLQKYISNNSLDSTIQSDTNEQHFFTHIPQSSTSSISDKQTESCAMSDLLKLPPLPAWINRDISQHKTIQDYIRDNINLSASTCSSSCSIASSSNYSINNESTVKQISQSQSSISQNYPITKLKRKIASIKSNSFIDSNQSLSISESHLSGSCSKIFNKSQSICSNQSNSSKQSNKLNHSESDQLKRNKSNLLNFSNQINELNHSEQLESDQLKRNKINQSNFNNQINELNYSEQNPSYQSSESKDKLNEFESNQSNFSNHNEQISFVTKSIRTNDKCHIDSFLFDGVTTVDDITKVTGPFLPEQQDLIRFDDETVASIIEEEDDFNTTTVDLDETLHDIEQFEKDQGDYLDKYDKTEKIESISIQPTITTIKTDSIETTTNKYIGDYEQFLVSLSQKLSITSDTSSRNIQHQHQQQQQQQEQQQKHSNLIKNNQNSSSADSLLNKVDTFLSSCQTEYQQMSEEHNKESIEEEKDSNNTESYNEEEEKYIDLEEVIHDNTKFPHKSEFKLASTMKPGLTIQNAPLFDIGMSSIICEQNDQLNNENDDEEESIKQDMKQRILIEYMMKNRDKLNDLLSQTEQSMKTLKTIGNGDNDNDGSDAGGLTIEMDEEVDSGKATTRSGGGADTNRTIQTQDLVSISSKLNEHDNNGTARTTDGYCTDMGDNEIFDTFHTLPEYVSKDDSGETKAAVSMSTDYLGSQIINGSIIDNSNNIKKSVDLIHFDSVPDFNGIPQSSTPIPNEIDRYFRSSQHSLPISSNQHYFHSAPNSDIPSVKSSSDMLATVQHVSMVYLDSYHSDMSNSITQPTENVIQNNDILEKGENLELKINEESGNNNVNIYKKSEADISSQSLASFLQNETLCNDEEEFFYGKSSATDCSETSQTTRTNQNTSSRTVQKTSTKSSIDQSTSLMKEQLQEWKKQRLTRVNKCLPSKNSENIITKNSKDRKDDVAEFKVRTEKLWSQLEEVQKQKKEHDIQKQKQKNQDKKKEYAEKVRQKLKEKQLKQSSHK